MSNKYLKNRYYLSFYQILLKETSKLYSRKHVSIFLFFYFYFYLRNKNSQAHQRGGSSKARRGTQRHKTVYEEHSLKSAAVKSNYTKLPRRRVHRRAIRCQMVP